MPMEGLAAATHHPSSVGNEDADLGAGRMSKQNHRNLAGSLRCCGGDHPLRKRSHDKEWRDWPNLPTVLLDDITGRLLLYDVVDYIRLRDACKEWRNYTDDPRVGGGLDCRFRPRRWIMLSNLTEGDGCHFLNLSTSASACVDLLELSRHHLETSTEGLLLLRGKASHAVRLFSPLTRAFTNLPSITPDLGRAYIVWTGLLESSERLIYAGISEETSPASVVLLMIDRGRAIFYAKTGDVFSYLVPPDDHRCGGMLMVRYYLDLENLSADERRIMTRRRKRMDVIRVENRLKECRWNLIQVFEVNVAGKRLVPVEDIGRHRAAFVGEAACFSPSARTFPCVAGNVVYLGATGARYPPVGVRYLADKSVDPPFEFTTDGPASPDEPLKWYHRHNKLELNLFLDTGPELNLVPLARPCTLQEYLICCAGLPGGLQD